MRFAFRLVIAAILALWLRTPSVRADSSFSTLVVFSGTNGAKPSSGLLLGADGNFYGTTMMGGANDIGTIFKVTSNGRLTTVASFNGRNGKWPSGDLVQGKDGSFYGTATQGGNRGSGVVFKLAQNGSLTGQFSFSDYDDSGGESPHGFTPYRLVDGNDDYFYGTTAGNRFGAGAGTVFRITPSGTLTTLATFDSQAEPAWLVRALNDRYYFTTARMAYRLAPLASLQSVKKLGSLNTLVQGKDGSFYGTSGVGGPKSGGTVFKMNPHGIVTNLVAFDDANSVNGRGPQGELLRASDGYFYGTTFAGDTNGPPPDFSKFLTKDASGAWVLINTNRPFPGVKPDLGTVFRMTPNGQITTLAVFRRTNGCYPTARLVQGKDGSFYGTTTEGGIGANASGTIFRFTVALPP